MENTEFNREIHWGKTQVKQFLNIRDKQLDTLITNGIIKPIGFTGSLNREVFDKLDIKANKAYYRQHSHQVKYNEPLKISLIGSAVIQIAKNNRIMYTGEIKASIENGYYLICWNSSGEHNVTTILHISELSNGNYYFMSLSDMKEILSKQDYMLNFPYTILKESK